MLEPLKREKMYSSVHHMKLSKIITNNMNSEKTSKIQKKFRNIAISMINLQDQISFLSKAITNLDI